MFEKGSILNTPIYGGSKGFFATIGSATDSLIYKDDFHNELVTMLNTIYNKEKTINKKIAFENFTNNIFWYIFEQRMNSLDINDNGIKEMFDEMYNKEIKKYSVFSDVYGIRLKDKSKVYSVSLFNIYYWPTTKIEIEKKSKSVQKILWSDKKHDYLIETTVEAADSQKALELAISLFDQFQYFMHIAIGRKEKRFNVSVNLEEFVHAKHTLLLCNGAVTTNTSLEGRIEAIPIDELFSEDDPKYGYEAMWNLLKLKEPNEFQKRIILALEWLGQAYRDTSFNTSFMKAAISLEAIFTYNEGAIITPSILHQLSESAALILGNNADECIEIEKEMKKLYSRRSSIVHAGNSEIDIKMIMDILNYSSCIILVLLNKKEYQKIKSVKELYDLLKLKKYNNPQRL
jgi:hypothetical protein